MSTTDMFVTICTKLQKKKKTSLGSTADIDKVIFLKLQDLPIRRNTQISTEYNVFTTYPSQAQEQTFYITQTQVTPSILSLSYCKT